MPVKNSSAGSSRRPALPAITTVPSSVTSTLGMFRRRIVVRDAAANGAAIADRQVRDLRGRLGQQRPALAHIGRCATDRRAGPARRPSGCPAPTCRRLSVSMRLISTMTAGLRMRRLSIGIRLWPPASTRPSCPASPRILQRLFQRARGVVVEPCRLHERLNPRFDEQPNRAPVALHRRAVGLSALLICQRFIM